MICFRERCQQQVRECVVSSQGGGLVMDRAHVREQIGARQATRQAWLVGGAQQSGQQQRKTKPRYTTAPCTCSHPGLFSGLHRVFVCDTNT